LYLSSAAVALLRHAAVAQLIQINSQGPSGRATVPT